MKNVVIVNSSPRKGGNSEILAKKFAEGAIYSGNSVTEINVRELDLKFCTGCLYCHSHEKCALNDSMNGLYSQIKNADVLVFATPVYYYAVSGQLKTFLDRLNPLYEKSNNFKDVYLIATAADDAAGTTDGCVSDLRGWVSCFEQAALKGVLSGIGVTERGDVNGTKFPQEAFEMGKKV